MASPPASQTWEDATAGFPSAAKPYLESIRTSGGVLPPGEVRALSGLLGGDLRDLMVALLPVAAEFAVAPISGFRVGAVALGRPDGAWGSLYLGANLEFAGEALSFAVHAEQSAVANAWLNQQDELQALAVSAAPCGYCRQFLYELAAAARLEVLLRSGTGQGHTSTTLTDLLPDPFGPRDLGIPGGLMDPKHQNHQLTLGHTDSLVRLALQAAQQSYAPYTCGFAGCAVQAADGLMYPGRYAENAAYNPSLSPLASALALMQMVRPLGADRTVSRAVLVELPSKTGQLSASRAVLAAAAPGVALEYHRATLAGPNPCAERR